MFCAGDLEMAVMICRIIKQTILTTLFVIIISSNDVLLEQHWYPRQNWTKQMKLSIQWVFTYSNNFSNTETMYPMSVFFSLFHSKKKGKQICGQQLFNSKASLIKKWGGKLHIIPCFSCETYPFFREPLIKGKQTGDC